MAFKKKSQQTNAQTNAQTTADKLALAHVGSHCLGILMASSSDVVGGGGWGVSKIYFFLISSSL